MVGGNSLFNPDPSPLTDCADKAGATTGLPDIAALANDINELCAPDDLHHPGRHRDLPDRPRRAPRPIKAIVGAAALLRRERRPDLHGLFLVPGDLPTTVQSATLQIAAQAEVGVTWDGTPKVSGRDEQPAYTPRIQAAKAAGATYIYMGSNDRAMIKHAQGGQGAGPRHRQGVGVLAGLLHASCSSTRAAPTSRAPTSGCSSCRSRKPTPTRRSKAYVDAVGADKVDSFGAQAWQARAGVQARHRRDRRDGRPQRHHPCRASSTALDEHRGLRRRRLDRARTRCAACPTASCCCRSRAARSPGSSRRRRARFAVTPRTSSPSTSTRSPRPRRSSSSTTGRGRSGVRRAATRAVHVR